MQMFEKKKNWYQPDCWSVAEESDHALGLMARQELIKVSILHVFSDHTQRVRAHTYCQQPDDVGVFQSWHDLYLLQEIIPVKYWKKELWPFGRGMFILDVTDGGMDEWKLKNQLTQNPYVEQKQ